MTHKLVSRVFTVLAASLAIALVDVGAQGGPPPVPPDGRPRGGMSRGGGMPRGGMAGDPQRMPMDRRLQDRINQLIRQRLALSDEQFDKMREVASRIEDDRRSLRSEEMTTRFAMRQELFAGDKANDKRVSELLDQMARIDRRRLDLQEREQRDLAKFLTATQRARYIGMQEELRREMQDLQRRRLDRDSADAGRMRPGARRLQRPPGTP